MASLGEMLKEIGSIIMSLIRIHLRLWIAQWKLLWPIIKPILFAIGWLVAQTIKGSIKWTQLLIDGWMVAFEAISAGLDWVEDNWSSWVDAVKQLGTDAVDFMMIAWQGFVDWFLGAIGRLIGKLDDFGQKILSIPGVQSALNLGASVLPGGIEEAFAPSSGRNPNPSATSNSVSQTNQVNVNVTEANATPQQIESAASRGVDEANARHLRLTQAALAGGEM
jgi:hypothetical protein